MQVSNQRQSGSVIIYVIVGVLLAVLAVGAIIVAQNRGGLQIAQRPSTQAPQSGTSNTPADQPQGDNKSNEQAQKEQADKKAAEQKAQQDAAAKKQADDKAAADKAAADKKAAEQQAAQQQAAATSGPMARTDVPSASHLPTTGPVEDTLSMVVGLMAILGAGYFYYHYGRRA